ncbi:MAG: TRAP transporter large permease [Tindallia sp. MSAO_Bac2]|nr:MAG: TRAP transporter large permease [Tindallia sp. MSAO_Bac2]
MKVVEHIGFIGIAVLLLLVFSGMRVAYAVMLVGGLGLFLVRGFSGGGVGEFLGYIPTSLAGTYTYSVIPLFILMGYFVYYSGLTDELFECASAWVRHIPGGLPIATALSCGVFAATSGASVASSAIFAKIAIPKMLDANVDKRLAAGIVATGGTIAALIPPSAIMVIFAILTEQSVAFMLMAGVLPGILTILFLVLIIYIRAKLDPALAPTLPAASWKERFQTTKKIFAIPAIIVIIIGGIYTGMFSPTEAGGMGAFVALIMVIAKRKLTMKVLMESLVETVKTTSFVFFLMIAITIFLRFLVLTGTVGAITGFALDLPISPIAVLTVILLIHVLLGMFMDAISMMMLTVPIFFPVVVALGYNPIWLGILVVKMGELSLITPPIGLNCYVVAGSTDRVSVDDVFRGILPFTLADVAVVILVIIFPALALYLPSMMG